MKYRGGNYEVIKLLHRATQYLTLLNFSVNPFIYAFASSSYRRGNVFLPKKIAFHNITTADTIKLRELQLYSPARIVWRGLSSLVENIKNWRVII